MSRESSNNGTCAAHLKKIQTVFNARSGVVSRLFARLWPTGIAAGLVLSLTACSWLPQKATPDPRPTVLAVPPVTPPHAAPIKPMETEYAQNLPNDTSSNTPSSVVTGNAPTEIPTEGAAGFQLQVQAPAPLQQLLLQHLPLQRFKHVVDLQDDELLRLLAAADPDARQLLATQGYFSPHLTLDIQAASAQAPRLVKLGVEPGPRTIVKAVDIALTDDNDTANNALPLDRQRIEQRIQTNWDLPIDRPFTQIDWDSAKAKGLQRLKTRRYPAANIASSLADIDADTYQASLVVTYSTGPAYRFGDLSVDGAERYPADTARRLARLPEGDFYSEDALIEAQQRLSNSGYYDAVFLSLDNPSPTPESATVIAQVREAQMQKMVIGIGASTDSGARLSLDHTHNQLPSLGWRAQSKLSIDKDNQLLGTEWTALPNKNGWRTYGATEVEREATGDYDVNSGSLRGGRTKSDKNVDRRYFLQYDYTLTQGFNAPPSSASITLNYGWTGRYFNNPNAPTNGYGLGLEWGVGSTLKNERAPFMRTLIRWQAFTPAGRITADNGQSRNSRIAFRAEAGAVWAQPGADIPVTQLFLTGGDTTVRGYGHRSIGSRTEDGQLYGGRYMAVASAEWQRPIVYKGTLTDFESAVFVDAGSVANHLREMRARIGVGAGVRWRSPVGPLQADIGYGVQSKQARLHVRLGFTF